MLNFGNKEFRNLQEQVLKNAQDIEILKEKPSLKIVIVEELPETGEEGILYLVPKDPDPDTGDADSYDEYVWLPESESFEMVGSTAIDLSNMVTTDTEQTITGEKTFTADVNVQGDVNVGGDVVADGKVVTKSTERCVCVRVLAQSHLSLCDPMDCSLPGSSAHGILQEKTPLPGNLRGHGIKLVSAGLAAGFCHLRYQGGP